MARSDEWTEMELDEGYRATIFLLGDRIIVGRPFGYATMKGIRKVLDISRSIIDEHLDPEAPYVHVQDYTHITGANLHARKYFSDEMKKRKRTLALVFCGQTPFGRIAFQLAARLHNFPCEMIITKEYPEAALAARRLVLKDSPSPPIDPSGPIRNREWNIDENDFKGSFEILEGMIVHSRLSGQLDETHVEELGRRRELVLSSIERSVPVYFLAGLGDLKWVSRKARKAMERQFYELSKSRSIDGVYVYGANTLIRSAVHLGRPFSGVKASVHGDFDSAMAALREDRSRAAGLGSAHTDKGAVCEDRMTSLTRHHVEEVLSYLSGLNWDREGVVRSPAIKEGHPLLPVFDALDLIKKDLDDLFREHRETVAELEKTRDGLWSRIAERTADLASANERLRQNNLARNRQVADLEETLGRIFTGISGELSMMRKMGGVEADTPASRIEKSLEEAETALKRFCSEGFDSGAGGVSAGQDGGSREREGQSDS